MDIRVLLVSSFAVWKGGVWKKTIVWVVQEY